MRSILAVSVPVLESKNKVKNKGDKDAVNFAVALASGSEQVVIKKVFSEGFFAVRRPLSDLQIRALIKRFPGEGKSGITPLLKQLFIPSFWKRRPDRVSGLSSIAMFEILDTLDEKIIRQLARRSKQFKRKVAFITQAIEKESDVDLCETMKRCAKNEILGKCHSLFFTTPIGDDKLKKEKAKRVQEAAKSLKVYQKQSSKKRKKVAKRPRPRSARSIF